MEVLIDGLQYKPINENNIFNHPDFHKEWRRQAFLYDMSCLVDYIKKYWKDNTPKEIMEREPFFKWFWEKNNEDIEYWEKRYNEKII